MNYKLKENLCLCGWDKLPFALLQRPENKLCFLQEEEFRALRLCDGTTDCDLFLYPKRQRVLVKKLAEEGIVLPCEAGDTLADSQNYRRYPNRLIHTVHWAITGRCNYRCKHCYLSAPDAKLGEPSHEQVMDIIDQLEACGIFHVSLTGGEPLLREDFREIVAKLSEKKIRITQIYSNGSLVDKALLELLEYFGQKPEFNMSYDGDDGWHDWMRGVPGAEKVVLDAFDLCHEHGFLTGSELCLHKGNVGRLRQSIQTLAAHHVSSCKVNAVTESALWRSNGCTDYSIGMEETAEAFLSYIPHFFEDGMPLTIQLGGFFLCEKGQTSWQIPMRKLDGSEHATRETVCGHARQTLYLSPEGRLLPCPGLSGFDIQNSFPQMDDIGLQQALSDSRYLQLIDMRVEQLLQANDECRVCEHRFLCGGGCRAGALAFDERNLMGPDRAACLLFKGGYQEKIQAAVDDAR